MKKSSLKINFVLILFLSNFVFFIGSSYGGGDQDSYLLSPDGKQSISVKMHENGQIIYESSSSTEKEVIAPNFNVSLDFSPWSSRNNPRQPFVWVDNTSILTQKQNGELYLIGLDSSVEHIVKISNVPKFMTYPIFEKKNESEFLYIVDSKKYKIDIDNKSFSVTE